MSNSESFPTTDDWEALWDEIASDAQNPQGNARLISHKFGLVIEPDWDALLED